MITLSLVKSDQELWSLVPEKNRTLRLNESNPEPLLITNISCGTDPLVHYGRHFGRTVHALCTVSALLNNGILRMGELQDQPEEVFTHESAFVPSIPISITY